MSESTKDYDRTEKFKAYGTIATFQEYVLISQTRRSIEQFSKIDHKKWSFRLYDEEDEAIELTAIDAQVSLNDLYDKVEFDVQEG
ncbi:MAG: Uma2 family endonuclease [Leptolyngbyaceae cyanobacterium SM1_3_5]|nr:Uma2 family endonuclease [Leptolyngbyaceae cyanobacterium SM1_3_5]